MILPFAKTGQSSHYDLLKQLTALTAPETGDRFFQVLVKGLSELLKMDHVFVGYALDHPVTRIRVQASWFKGKERDSWDYDLAGNPCAIPYDHQVAFIPKDLGELFEKKRGSGYQSFIGIPLCDLDGDVFGHLAVYGARQLGCEGVDLEISSLFAQRAEAEIKRTILETRLSDSVKQLEHANLQLAIQNSIDHLTGCLNRREFSKRASVEFSRARRYNENLGYLFLDIDHFKHINDDYGHAAGDQALTAVANVLFKSVRREVDAVGRMGGEEFALLIPNTDQRGLLELAERLRQHIQDIQLDADGQMLHLTCSIGVASFSPNDLNWEEGLRHADQAMYLAKNNGRNRVELFAETTTMGQLRA